MARKLTIKIVSFKTLLLYISAFLTLCFMVMCLLSAWFSMVSLRDKLGVYMNEFKAQQVSQYEAPAIMFLANGLYTFECITSHFRFDPRPADTDFDTEGRDLEDPRLRIQDSCHENATEYSITLADISNYEDVIQGFPDWLKKNLVSTTDISLCELSEKRKRRDHTDDLLRCDGDCGTIWHCANNPQPCVEDGTFDICFTKTHMLSDQEPCTTHRECIGREAVFPAQCGTWIGCMDPDTIDEVECLPVWDCFYTGQAPSALYFFSFLFCT